MTRCDARTLQWWNSEEDAAPLEEGSSTFMKILNAPPGTQPDARDDECSGFFLSSTPPATPGQPEAKSAPTFSLTLPNADPNSGPLSEAVRQWCDTRPLTSLPPPPVRISAVILLR